MRMFGIAAAVACTLFAMPALAGGRLVAGCPAGYAVAYDARGGAVCQQIGQGGVVVVQDQRNTGTRFRRPAILCPYPYRPSDSAFSGGSGYIIKDDVRRANGCL